MSDYLLSCCKCRSRFVPARDIQRMMKEYDMIPSDMEVLCPECTDKENKSIIYKVEREKNGI